MSTGDILAQTIVEKKTFQEYSTIRTLQFGSLGIAFVGPLCTTWYRLLARKVGTKGTVVALKKVALDQMICAPVMTMAVVFCTVGFCFLGPTLTVWYRLLAKHVGMKGSLVTVKKVALDQFLFAPFCIGALLTVLGTVQGQPPKETMRKLKRDYTDIMIANYKLWPAVQLLNFYVVPLNYQVLVVQCVALSWNTYISWKTQSQKNDVE
ncbi:hypothetical protein Trydic_g525 [Trypoxylus dichotomus]